MGVVVVQASAVVNDQIAFQVRELDPALAILLQVDGLVFVVEEFRDLKAAHVEPRVFECVIPEGDKILAHIAADQFHGLYHHVHGLVLINLDAVLGF